MKGILFFVFTGLAVDLLVVAPLMFAFHLEALAVPLGVLAGFTGLILTSVSSRIHDWVWGK